MPLRKISCFLMALVLTLGLCVPAGAVGEEIGFVVVRPEQPPKAGETFTVTVELTGGVEFSTVQFTLRCNEEELTCTGIVLGDVLSGALAASNPSASDGALVAATSLSPMRASGTVATLTFTAKKDVTDPGFALTDIVLSSEHGQSLAYTVTGAATETPASPPEGDKSQPGDVPENEDAPISPEIPSFPDAGGHWGETFISRAVAMGLFKGYDDGSFRPDESVTRAQFVTVLWRLAGTPETSGSTPFTDTASLSQEFQNAVAWGYANQYINGKSSGIFDPNGVLTRQEAMTILFRYSGGVSGMEAMFTGIYDGQFLDSGQVAAWAKPGMYWGVYHELISGVGGGVLSPGTDVTRAQLAKIMVQYVD